MAKGVKYIWEILREVAKEEGRDYEEVKELWRLHREYLKEKILEDNTHIIEVPQIGNLYYSTFLYRLVEGKSRNKSESLERKAVAVDSKLEEDRSRDKITKYKYPQTLRPNILKLYKSINLHMNGIKKKYSTKNKIIKEIEKYSNGE